MNMVRYAGWMKEEGFVISLYCVAQTPLHDEAVRSGLEVRIIRRNGKYFDLMNGWRVAKTFRDAHVDVCWFRDTRDMDLLGWAKRFSGSRFGCCISKPCSLAYRRRISFTRCALRPSMLG